MLDPTTQEEGQLGKMMNLRKTPMDMNINRNVKLIQVSSQVAEKASSDGTTNKQCRPVHRQSTETTVTDSYTYRPYIRGRTWRPRRLEPTVR